MHRFFLPTVSPGVPEFPLSPGDTGKICQVLRLRPGTEILLWDNAGREYRARITRIAGRLVYVQVVTEWENSRESPLPVVLVQGIPKGDKMDLVIQKATELGVWEVCPVLTERTVVQVPLERRHSRLQRWQAIAREAARQSGRQRIPVISEIISLSAFWERPAPGSCKLVCWEQEGRGLKDYLRSSLPPPDGSVYLFIGPEGGFSQAEVARGLEQGAVTVSLGRRILRTETAGLVGLSLVLYEWGDLGSAVIPRCSIFEARGSKGEGDEAGEASRHHSTAPTSRSELQ